MNTKQDEDTAAGCTEGRVKQIQRQQESDPEFWALFESTLEDEESADVDSAVKMLLSQGRP